MTVSKVVLGYQAVVEIQGDVAGAGPWGQFGVRGGSCELAADNQECGDSLTGKHKANKQGRDELRISLDFYEKEDLNPHGAPLNVGVDGEIGVRVYPHGLLEASPDPYEAPSFIVVNYKVTWNVDGKIEGTLSGASNGDFHKPGDP